MSTTVPEIDVLKSRLKETWMAGDYDRSPAIWSRAHAFSTNNSTFLPDVSCSTWLAARVSSRCGQHAMECASREWTSRRTW